MASPMNDESEIKICVVPRYMIVSYVPKKRPISQVRYTFQRKGGKMPKQFQVSDVAKLEPTTLQKEIQSGVSMETYKKCFLQVRMCEERILNREESLQKDKTVLASFKGNKEQRYAIKIFSQLAENGMPKNLTAYYNELAVLTHAKHDHILKAEWMVKGPERCLIASPFYEQGDLLDHLGSIPMSDCYTYCRQILHAVNYLHRNLIVHGDISLVSLLVSQDDRGDKQVTLAGFGHCQMRQVPDQLLQAWDGDGVAWPAPEWGLRPTTGELMDCFQVGVVLWYLSTNLLDEPVLYHHDVLEQQIYGDIGHPYVDIIASMLDLDPAGRIMTSQALSVLDNWDWSVDNDNMEED